MRKSLFNLHFYAMRFDQSANSKKPHQDKVIINMTANEILYFKFESISNWLVHGIIAQDITFLF